MKNKNTITMRTDPQLKAILDDLRIERFRSGKDKKLISPARMSLAAARALRLPNVKKIVLEGKIDE